MRSLVCVCVRERRHAPRVATHTHTYAHTRSWNPHHCNECQSRAKETGAPPPSGFVPHCYSGFVFLNCGFGRYFMCEKAIFGFLAFFSLFHRCSFTPKSLSTHRWVSPSNCWATPPQQLGFNQPFSQEDPGRVFFSFFEGRKLETHSDKPSNNKVHFSNLLALTPARGFFALRWSQDHLAGSLLLLPQITSFVCDNSVQLHELRNRLTVVRIAQCVWKPQSKIAKKKLAWMNSLFWKCPDWMPLHRTLPTLLGAWLKASCCCA